MDNRKPGPLAQAQLYVHWIGVGLVAVFAAVMVIASIGAAFGRWPWLEISARYGANDIAKAGPIAQLAFTGLAVLLLFYLPGTLRTMRLENSHRAFNVSMDDVARAYRQSHEADRRGLFRIGSEFDSVRERIKELRDHPDLGALEPEVLELAAQMSHTARGIADVYSEEKVARARTFLKQRQQEADSYLETLAMAKKTVEDLKHWLLQIETEEGLAQRQIAVLESDLMELLPKLGFELEPEVQEADIVVPMHPTRPKTPSHPET